MADRTQTLTEPEDIAIGYSDLGGGAEFAMKVAVVSGGGSPTPATILNQSAVSAAAVATLVSAANANRKSLLIRNIGLVNVFLGPAGVTIANGQQIAPNEALEDTATTAAWYAIVAAGTCELRVTEATT